MPTLQLLTVLESDILGAKLQHIMERASDCNKFNSRRDRVANDSDKWTRNVDYADLCLLVLTARCLTPEPLAYSQQYTCIYSDSDVILSTVVVSAAMLDDVYLLQLSNAVTYICVCLQTVVCEIVYQSKYTRSTVE